MLGQNKNVISHIKKRKKQTWKKMNTNKHCAIQKEKIYIPVHIYICYLYGVKHYVRDWRKLFFFYVKIMAMHYVLPQLVFGRTWVNFVWPISNEWLLFAAQCYDNHTHHLPLRKVTVCWFWLSKTFLALVTHSFLKKQQTRDSIYFFSCQ